MGEEMLRLGGVAVIAVSIALVLKNQRPELALQVSIVTGIVLLAAAIAKSSRCFWPPESSGRKNSCRITRWMGME